LTLPSIAIEIDGNYWHRDRANQDKEKNRILSNNGINVIRIREEGLQPIGDYDISYKEGDHWIVIDNLCKVLTELIHDRSSKECLISYRASGKFVNENEYRRIVSFLPGPTPENSIDVTHPMAAATWSDQLNAPLISSMFSKGSNFRAWWICSNNPEHVWPASISNRTKGHDCPYCYGQNAPAENNLAVKFPEIAAQWHPERNGKDKPEDYKPLSNRKVWWRCSVNPNHEWQAQIASRTNLKSGCPYCSGRYATAENNLAKANPGLAAQWHPTKNGALTPADVTPQTNKKVWWVCPKDPEHAWLAAIGGRYSGIGCPHCRRRK
jgi:hypothetical protein